MEVNDKEQNKIQKTTQIKVSPSYIDDRGEENTNHVQMAMLSNDPHSVTPREENVQLGCPRCPCALTLEDPQ